MANGRTILLAGGGTGGHIFPNMAVLERLREHGADIEPHFIVSTRPLDAAILDKQSLAYTPLDVQPWPRYPWRWPGFFRAWRDSVAFMDRLIAERGVTAVIATGGFVSGPVAIAAERAGVPVLLVNLDAVPGRSNSMLARHATTIFTAYDVSRWREAQRIGVPVRRSALANTTAAEARKELDLDADTQTLLVTGASQGAQSVNRMMIEIAGYTHTRRVLREWQVLHLAGDKDLVDLRKAYERAGIRAVVEPFCDRMGLAWGAASVAVRRAGAGRVAEVWYNAVPTIFLPYPHHRDDHQRLNAEPLVASGGAKLFADLVDPEANAKQVGLPLVTLMSNAPQRAGMRDILQRSRPEDGAETVARAVMKAVEKGSSISATERPSQRAQV